MRIYFAAPLFTQAERLWNRKLADSLIAAGHSVFLPQEEIRCLECLEADAVFQLDVNGIRAADLVLAVLDGADPDSGTCFECGLAYALKLPILVVRTDFRAGGDALPGQRLAPVNLMLSQAASQIVHLAEPAESFSKLVDLILNALASFASPNPSI